MAYGKFCWRLQSPMKLTERCIERIAQMLLEINNKIRKKKIRKPDENSTEQLSDVRNLLFDLPRSIIEEIINKLVDVVINCDDTRESAYFSPELKTLKIDKDIFSILLCKPLQRLELRLQYIHSSDLDDIFKMIQQTKSQLSVLKIKQDEWRLWSDHLPVSDFPHMNMCLRDCTSLTHLKIEMRCDDSLLEMVGANCANLKFLQVCSLLLSSGGLKRLCLNPDDLTKRCQKLESLILDNCYDVHMSRNKDLTDGIVALFLGLPQLALLECPGIDMGKVYRLAYHKNDPQQQHTQLEIRKMTYTRSFCQQFNSSHLPNLCTHLKALTLDSVSSDELASFPVIATLREVTFVNIWNKTDFDHGVVPFLQNNGKFLKALRIRSSLYFNYTLVDQMCMNLKELDFWDVRTYDGSLLPEPVFIKVESLLLCSCEEAMECSAELIHLISYCHNLRHLTISLIQLSRDYLMKIISHNPFLHLVSINIDSPFMSINGKTSDAATPLPPFLFTLPEMYDPECYS